MIATNIKPEIGKILISEPFLQDSHFRRSVVFLTDHNEKGTIGFIINKPIAAPFNDILQDFPLFESVVYYGGPVQNNSLFYIHKRGDLLEDANPLNEQLFFGGNFKKLQELMANHLIQPHEIRFFIGYSGWEKNQLENELKEDSWLVSDFESENMFNIHYKDMWKKSIKNLGGEYVMMANFPENPMFN